ncbi:MAG TPA: S8 family serine peptidase [Patescibacteria group bacterium]|nr:S8 family serine peptidase [Patescibacteria group bacterium]
MKSFFIFGLFTFCTAASSAQDFSKTKIISDGKTEILSNTAVVRFKTFKDNSFVETSLQKTAKAQVARQFLKPEESFTFNKNLLKKSGNSILSVQKITQIKQAEEPLLKTVIITYEGKETPQEFCRRLLKENAEVELAEPYYVERMLGVPNDPLKSQQAYLNTIRAHEAWNIFEGDTSVVIAIADNGVLQTHEDLKNSIARNWGEIPNNGVDDDGNGYVDDFEGYTFEPNVPKGSTQPGTSSNANHGTNVAGIAGATWNNGLGISGVGGKCRIFPLKVSPNGNDGSIVYGYEAIMYAARNNFKVINCSWGSANSYSFVNQTVVDYAVSRGVAIVAAAGNDANSAIFYPAGYLGVLGVGETDQFDGISNVSNFGAHVDIMAPGDAAYTTNRFDDYGEFTGGGGTSAATPMVSGMVALIRAKHPQLSALQALEFARRSVDPVGAQNPFNTQLIPGRMNLLKAMSGDPLASPAIRPLRFETFTTSMKAASRFSVGDTAIVKIFARNELGAGKNVRFTLSAIDETGSSVEVLVPESDIADITPSSEFIIENFAIAIRQPNRRIIFLRVDMVDANGYEDYFLLPFIPTSEVTTYKNNIASYSVSDRGRIGYNTFESEAKEGVGFVYSNFGSILYKGGLIVAQSPQKVVSAVENQDFLNEFSVVKPFASPDVNTGIINDDNAGTKKIGMEITQYFTILRDSNGVAYAKISLKNTSSAILNDIAAGYYFDWDVSSSGSADRARLFPEGIPQNSLKTAAACIVEATQFDPVAGCAVSTSQPGAEAQVTIYNNTELFHQGFDDTRQFESVTSGTSMLFTGTSDISVVVGMKFNGAWEPGEVKSFILLFGAAKNATELQTRFQAMLDSTFSRVGNGIVEEKLIKISPQPAHDVFMLEGNVPFEKAGFSIISLDGRIIVPEQPLDISSGAFKTFVTTDNLPAGMYFVKIDSGNITLMRPLIIAR